MRINGATQTRNHGTISDVNVFGFSVQVGAGGYGIARALAKKLHYTYYDWAVTSRVIAEAGISPLQVEDAAATASFSDRVVRQLALANIMEDELPPAMTSTSFHLTKSSIASLSSEHYRTFIENVVKDVAAERKSVIVGHGACVILKDDRTVLKVLIRASMQTRARRVAEENGSSLEEAKGALEQSDRLKSRYLHEVYGIDWLDAENYDVVVTTDRIAAASAVESLASLTGRFVNET